MKLSARATKALRYGAFGAIGGALALSPLGLAGANPEAEPGGPAAPVTVTATVTAIVAPDQCEPVPDGKLPQLAVDYATTGDPITPEAQEPVDERANEEVSTEGTVAEVADGEIRGSGPFDPYLCVPQPEAPTTAPETPEIDEGPKLEDIPGVTPTLRPYPGTGGGLAESSEGGSGVELGTPDPDAEPTETPQSPGGLAPPRSLN